MGHFIHLLHTLQGTLNSIEGNFLVNDKGDFIIDHSENFIEVVSDVPPTPPPPPPPWGDPHVSVIGAIETDANYYFPTYNYYCYSLTQQIYTSNEINFSGYLTGIVFYPRGTCSARTLSVYITPTTLTNFYSNNTVKVDSTDIVLNPKTTSVATDEPIWLQFDNPYYYDGTSNLIITVYDSTGSWDSKIMFDVFTTPDVCNAIHCYTDTYPGYDPYVENAVSNYYGYKNSIQLLFNNAEPQGPVAPTDHYFMFTNHGDATTVLFRTASPQGKVFVNDEYAGKFSGDTGASFNVPANATIKVSGLKGFGNYNYSRGVIECTDSNANLSIDRFDESVAEYTDTDRVYMFGKNTGLKTITSWAGAENYTSLDRMFAYSDINTIMTWEGLENVTSMYYAFANSELTTIPSTWAGLNNVTNMSTTFSATKLTAIPVTWEGLENVTTMYYAFNGITTLTTIPSSWKGLENVTDMRQIFHGATSLSNIPMAWQYLSSVETLDHAFDNTAITMVPSTWAGLSRVTSMQYTFANTGLTSIPSSWTGLESVVNMLDTFSNTLISTLPSSWTGLESLSNMQYTFRNTPITALPSSWSPLTNVTLMTYAFGGCISLTSIPSTWEGLSSVTSMSYTFDGCSSLTNIPSTWVGLSSLTDMSYMFRNCSALTSIPDSWNGLDNVTNMSYAFIHNSSLTSGGITGFEHLSKLAKLPQAFRDCTLWTGDSLALCRSLRARNMTTYPSGWDFSYAFYNCSASTNYRYVPTDWGGLGDIIYDTVEIGGKTYRTVQIYNQIWLADNLDYAFDGLTIDPTMGYSSYGNERNVGPRACYLEDEETAKSKNHGLTYNWYALNYLEENKSTLLPDGWRVPVFEDFETLVKYSSTSSEFGKNSGKNLKSKTEWGSPGINYDGFDVLPAGMYEISTSQVGPRNLDTNGCFWTLTVSSNSTGYYCYYTSIGSSNDASIKRDGVVGGTTRRKSIGFHARLVKSINN